MDYCSIDVNETISNLVKNRYEKKDINNTNVTSNNQGVGFRGHQLMNTEQMSDNDLIDRVIARIANIKLNI